MDDVTIYWWFWLVGIAGWMMWNILLWGMAHNESEKNDEKFNWKEYRRNHTDDAIVTLFVGVPICVWKNPWLWDNIMNGLLSHLGVGPFEYDTIGLLGAGPLCQLMYMGIKYLANFRLARKK